MKKAKNGWFTITADVSGTWWSDEKGSIAEYDVPCEVTLQFGGDKEDPDKVMVRDLRRLDQ
jgi:hypothetical protein